MRINRVKSNHYGRVNGNDTVPIKELFYDETFDKKMHIRRDGTWYFKDDVLENDNAVVQYGQQGIRV